jgi:hypothetical protein
MTRKNQKMWENSKIQAKAKILAKILKIQKSIFCYFGKFGKFGISDIPGIPRIIFIENQKPCKNLCYSVLDDL